MQTTGNRKVVKMTCSLYFSGVFYFYLGICCIGFTFLFFLLKETKNKTLEEVQELFMSKKYKAKLAIERQGEKDKSEHVDINNDMTKF